MDGAQGGRGSQTLDPKPLNPHPQVVRKAAEDALVQIYEEDADKIGEMGLVMSRIKGELREMNCHLEPGFASLIGMCDDPDQGVKSPRRAASKKV